jgi:hypothetical protein
MKASIRAEMRIRDLPNTRQKHDRLSQLSRPRNEIHSCLVLIQSGQIRQISQSDIIHELNHLLSTVVDSKDWLPPSQWFHRVRRGKTFSPLCQKCDALQLKMHRLKCSCVLCMRLNIIFLLCSTWLVFCKNFTFGLL